MDRREEKRRRKEKMSRWNYVVTAHKPANATHSCVGNFTSPHYSLIKLNQQPDAKGSYVEVLERYVNLGPIVDLCVADLERPGQGQVVTCSGAYKDGSIRIVSNKIGLNEQVSVELHGITGMWSQRSSTNDPFDTSYL